MYLLGGQTKKLMTWKLNSNFIFRTQNKLLKFTLFPGGFPGGSGVKNPSAKTGDSGLIPESGRSPREGNGNPFQYSCLGNLMDRGGWWATVHGVEKSRTWLCSWAHNVPGELSPPLANIPLLSSSSSVTQVYVPPPFKPLSSKHTLTCLCSYWNILSGSEPSIPGGAA